MRDAVLAAFPSFTAQLEGVTSWAYPDVLGKVTVGEGDLIDSVPEMLALEWERPDGSLASPSEVEAAFWTVKNSGLGHLGGEAPAVQRLTTIRLTRAAVDALVRSKLSSDEKIFAARVGVLTWGELCSDAQLGALSLCWACGPYLDFPHFLAALRREDFARYDAHGALLPGCCAKECYMSPEHNPGNDLTTRNNLNQRLFEAAQRVVDQNLDPDVLTGWP